MVIWNAPSVKRFVHAAQVAVFDAAATSSIENVAGLMFLNKSLSTPVTWGEVAQWGLAVGNLAFFNTLYGSLSDTAFLNAISTNLTGGPLLAASQSAFQSQLDTYEEQGYTTIQSRAIVAANFAACFLGIDVTSAGLTAADQATLHQQQTIALNKTTISGDYANVSGTTNGEFLKYSTNSGRTFQAAQYIVQGVGQSAASVATAYGQIQAALAACNTSPIQNSGGSAGSLLRRFSLRAARWLRPKFSAIPVVELEQSLYVLPWKHLNLKIDASVRAARWLRPKFSAIPVAQEVELEQSLCVLPWKHLNLKIDGSVQLCCQGPRLNDALGNPLTIYEHSLGDIWNSANMRAIRQAMVSGVRVDGCRKCWEVEERGGISRRLEVNDLFLKKEEMTMHQLKADAERDSFHCHQSPSDYQLDLGNTCNLKCRTCLSQYSSRIAADPVHRRWEGVSFRAGKWSGDGGIGDNKSGDLEDRPIASRFPTKLPWYEDSDFLFGELLKHPEHISGLQIIGGEPLVAAKLAPVIHHIASKGLPDRVTLALTTNGTRFDPPLFDMLAGFEKISISVSIDGIGEYFEYIRYPGKWLDIVEHLDRYAKASNVELCVLPTFHIYNALHIADLFRFCDDRKLPLIFNTLWHPPFLAASVLPPKARRVAIDRLRKYARATQVHAHRLMAETLVRELEEKGGSFDLKLIRQFVLFTNDLDSSRKKRFTDLYGELVSLMAEDGIEWTDEILYAAPPSPPSPTTSSGSSLVYAPEQ